MNLNHSTVAQRLNDPIKLHMRAQFSVLRATQTIEQALQELRKNPPQGRVIYFYAVDDENRLQGVVPTRRLLLNEPQTVVQDIMIGEVIAIPQDATVLDVCEFFILHRLLAYPVINEKREIVGVVDVELYTDELVDLDRMEKRENEDDLFQLIGIHLSDAKPSSPFAAFQSRFPWLIANISGGILAAFLTGFYEAEIQKAVALALFIPVVLALAESVSIQSVSLALQVLHGKQPSLQSIIKKLRKEVVTGLFLGVACGLAVASVALLWLGQVQVVLCLFGGIAGGVTFAAVIGVAMPNLLRYFQRDPQVAAGPIALAATDMVTLLIYFTLARMLIG